MANLINLGVYSTADACAAPTAQNALVGFGLSYSFNLNQCYVIAGPPRPPSLIPTYATTMNGAPPGQFFIYTLADPSTASYNLSMCTTNTCQVCSQPQPVYLDECITSFSGFDQYNARTTVSQQPLYPMAPLASINWLNVPFDPTAVSTLQPASMAMGGESSSGTSSSAADNGAAPAQAGSNVDQPMNPLTNEGVNTHSTGAGSSLSAAHACSPQSAMAAVLGGWAVLAIALVF